MAQDEGPLMIQAADCQTHLMALAKDYARALRDLLGDRLVSVVLYGSVARGEAGPSSDLDLLIVMETLPAGQFARRRRCAALTPWSTNGCPSLRRRVVFLACLASS
jgi:predicted nucleotidyltransferase